MTQQTPYKAPDFSAIDQNEISHSLGDYTGRWLVIYFYPKDNTPGCTVEACSLRDARDELGEMGAHVIGVSMDDPLSHEKFHAEHALNFTLLSDPSAEMIRAYGAWGKKMFGREGILRKTFIIDPEGMVQKVYGRVTPMNHGPQIIQDLKKLQAEQ